MVLNIFFIVGVSVFIAAYTLQIIAIRQQNEKMRKITKPFIVAGILLSAVSAMSYRLPDSRNIIIWTSLSLLSSFAGDILLLDTSSKKRVISGAGCFILSNLSYVILMSPSLKLFPLPAFAVILCILFYVAVFVAFWLFIAKKPGVKATAAMIFYFFFEVFLHYEIFITFISSPAFYSFLFGLGIVTLISSDMILARRLCKLSGPNNRLLVMIIYPFSQLFMAAGAFLMCYNL